MGTYILFPPNFDFHTKTNGEEKERINWVRVGRCNRCAPNGISH